MVMVTLYYLHMRVVEPHQFKGLPKRRSKKNSVIAVGALLLVICGAVAWHTLRPSGQVLPVPNEAIITEQAVPPPLPKTGILKQFSGEEFKQLYQSMVYPNTQDFTEPPIITGNVEADNRIRRMAEARGYRMTSIPTQAIMKINEPRLDNDDLLQPLAAKDWLALKEDARAVGIRLSLVSAYRSPQFQRELFTSRLFANGITPVQVAAAQADFAVEQTLSLAALPGYSRHHTGYTVDLWCEDGSATFLASSCFKWVSDNNYLHAKDHGWIPSYPEGANEQGPEPEPWEYVWVGRDRLTE